MPAATAPQPELARQELLQQRMEHRKCRRCCAYFVDTYCQVLDEEAGSWVPFKLWNAQAEFLDVLDTDRLVVALKARQLGLTWAVLSRILWLVLFHPISTVLIFSRRDKEAVDLLKNRLKEMHRRLPPWLQASASPVDNDHEWGLLSGSRVQAFPCTAGDSYTASLVFIDEADLVPDLDRLLRAVKPTIDAGGKLILLSRSDKTRPESAFKKIYRAAKAQSGQSQWKPVFIPWHARPGRDVRWYAQQKLDVLLRTGSLDDLHEQYPATDVEALAARTLDKRIPPDWLNACYAEQPGLSRHRAPAVPGLVVYREPEPHHVYCVGADPAEGNPTSDPSAACVTDALTGEQVAEFAGQFQPSTFASYLDAVGSYYNSAALLVERNNHGHAVLLWLEANSPLTLLCGHDGRPGWLSSGKGKVLLYDAVADAFRHGEVTLHSFATLSQLQSIEGGTLRAPEGLHDDRADACALAVVGAPAAAAAAEAEDEEPTVLRA